MLDTTFIAINPVVMFAMVIVIFVDVVDAVGRVNCWGGLRLIHPVVRVLATFIGMPASNFGEIVGIDACRGCGGEGTGSWASRRTERATSIALEGRALWLQNQVETEQ